MEVSMELDHPFLVKLLQAFETSHFYCMVFECTPFIIVRLPRRRVVLPAEEGQDDELKHGQVLLPADPIWD